MNDADKLKWLQETEALLVFRTGNTSEQLGIESETLAAWISETPVEFVEWHMTKYDLTDVNGKPWYVSDDNDGDGPYLSEEPGDEVIAGPMTLDDAEQRLTREFSLRGE